MSLGVEPRTAASGAFGDMAWLNGRPGVGQRCCEAEQSARARQPQPAPPSPTWKASSAGEGFACSGGSRGSHQRPHCLFSSAALRSGWSADMASRMPFHR